MLAAAVDHLAVANWMTGTLHSDEDADPLDYPEPVPRPGAEDSTTEVVTTPPSEMADHLPAREQLTQFFA
ncbi:hypothetical protein ACSNOK_17930 [Streptomyces sp. URMC 126]|uniref:hypothetical protein n=1 Tax=Streptomyces sp. URMC 126 TaxID=3423401 RepID=UPI003F1981B9